MLSKSAFTTLFVAVTFGMAFSQEVAAQPTDGTTYSKTVRYSDLDLSTDAGAQSLLSRIRRAANAVCGGDDWRVQINLGRSSRTCVREASSKAVADVGNPTVTAMYNGSKIRLAKK